MSHFRAGPVLILLLLAACVPAQQSWEPRALDLPSLADAPLRPDRLILVSVAGLTPDVYRGPDPAAPVLALLAGVGVSADRVLPVAPPTAYPAHATLITGEPPSVHGIVADRVMGERGVRISRFWHASHLRSTPLWQRAAESELRVASLAWPSTLGSSIGLLIPDLAPTRRGESWLQLIESSSTPLLVKWAREHGAESPANDLEGDARDGVLVGVACELLDGEDPPELLLLRLSGAIPAIALAGKTSPAARAAMGRVDGQVGRLLSCLRDRGLSQTSALAVVGDHGTAPIHTAIRLNAILARAGLIRKDGWRAITRSNGGSAFLYARDEEAAIHARQLFEREAVRSAGFRIVSAEEMLGLEADPAAWFGLEGMPGYAFAPGTNGAVQSAAASLATGGYLLQPMEMGGGFIGWGAGFRRGVRVPRLDQVDVAPTLAQLLGFDLGEIEGRALVGVVWPDLRPSPN